MSPMSEPELASLSRYSHWRRSCVSRQALYKALSSDGNPEFATILKVIRALGFRLHPGPASA